MLHAKQEVQHLLIQLPENVSLNLLLNGYSFQICPITGHDPVKKEYTVKVSKASSFCPVPVNLNWYIYFDKSPYV